MPSCNCNCVSLHTPLRLKKSPGKSLFCSRRKVWLIRNVGVAQADDNEGVQAARLKFPFQHLLLLLALDIFMEELFHLDG